MKYTLHENLVLNLEPETREEQALIDLLRKMELRPNGHGVKNLGMSFSEGRRSYLSFKFVAPQLPAATDSSDNVPTVEQMIEFANKRGWQIKMSASRERP